MGRDLYDAAFFISQTQPDLDYLREKTGINNINELRQRILKRFQTLDLSSLAREIIPFIPDPANAKRVEYFPEIMEKALLEK